ncbi:alginate lyase family protein [Jannaschia sp. W003]|uniref:alginate lyase family protein n=1 Tax=Jannaschia sp. W003 TaxID=2867012 RepID=UPI0021A4DB45|nr:alginate lyase family protein [Jannaschia sp. W003]UWQ22094.1 alginate lyase family protein [Jannaschia sp. W003]
MKGPALALLAAVALAPSARAAAAGDCAAHPPVLGLAFESRYEDGDATRSTLDADRKAAVLAAIEPLDSFVTALAGDEGAAGADCTLARLAAWAEADALAGIGTETAALTLGSRLAGLAIVAGEAAAHRPGDPRIAPVAAWLARRMTRQMRFWERAPDGAASGNLRAWAALAGAAVADLADDPVMRGWAAWSATYVACTADAAGALPQEMGRGPRAMHYQLHAVAPLAVTAAILRPHGIDLRARCGGALDRVVGFTLEELETGGPRVAALAGEAQTTFERGVQGFQLAWIEAWLALVPDARAERMAAPHRPLNYSKLGGDQTRLWSGR